MLAICTTAAATAFASMVPLSRVPARPCLASLRQQPTALAPSGIDELPYALQQLTFAAAFASLGAATYSSAAVYESARQSVDSVWWQRWEVWSAATLGVTFVLAGRSHFTVPEAFKAIYPPLGTWGFWYLPGSSDFHVAWTGVAELLGGSGLLGGCLLSIAGQEAGAILLVWAARAVFFLILAVSPANLYMYTHGAVMPGVTPDELPLGWHAGRFAAQAIVLSVLLTTAQWGPASTRPLDLDLEKATRRGRGGSPHMQELSEEEIEAKLAKMRRPVRSASKPPQASGLGSAEAMELGVVLVPLALVAAFSLEEWVRARL